VGPRAVLEAVDKTVEAVGRSLLTIKRVDPLMAFAASHRSGTSLIAWWVTILKAYDVYFYRNKICLDILYMMTLLFIQPSVHYKQKYK
jgi:hypothetical protein